MSEQERSERPPTSGAGSGVAVWREYAAAVTDSPVESWGEMSREDIIELLDSDEKGTQIVRTPGGDQAQERPHRPVWMVPTPDGMVPEHELRRRR